MEERRETELRERHVIAREKWTPAKFHGGGHAFVVGRICEFHTTMCMYNRDKCAARGWFASTREIPPSERIVLRKSGGPPREPWEKRNGGCDEQIHADVIGRLKTNVTSRRVQTRRDYIINDRVSLRAAEGGRRSFLAYPRHRESTIVEDLPLLYLAYRY